MRSHVLTHADYFPDARARVMVHRQPQQGAMGLHGHEFWEVVVIQSGTALHNAGGVRHRIGRGDILVIGEQAVHGYEEPDGLNLINILISRQTMGRIERDLIEIPGYHVLFRAGEQGHPEGHARMRLSAPDLEQVVAWTDLLEVESRRGTAAGYLVSEAYLTLIIALIARRWNPNNRHHRAAESPGDLRALIGWMEAHLADPLTVGELARRAGMSERSFFRRFREVTGMSPVDYLLRVRLQRAAALLARRGPRRLSIKELSAQCGFRDPRYFATAFRRQFGQPPSSLRGQGVGRALRK